MNCFKFRQDAEVIIRCQAVSTQGNVEVVEQKHFYFREPVLYIKICVRTKAKGNIPVRPSYKVNIFSACIGIVNKLYLLLFRQEGDKALNRVPGLGFKEINIDIQIPVEINELTCFVPVELVLFFALLVVNR